MFFAMSSARAGFEFPVNTIKLFATVASYMAGLIFLL